MRRHKPSTTVQDTSLTFDEICPSWSTKLKGALDKDDLYTLIRKPETCIVGEAWGYTSRYLGYMVVYLIPFVGCFKCIKYGNKIGETAKQYNERCRNYLQPMIDDFVDHWNKKHQEITMKKNAEKKIESLKTTYLPISS
ncbi:MAG: hypothetical protein ACRD8W_10975 [Nitrososphaeraceae archaeon]